MKRKLAILGATGSIGMQAIDVALQHADKFEITALVANTSSEKLFELVRKCKPKMAGLTTPIPRSDIPSDLDFCEFFFGEDALLQASVCDCDDVLVAVVGMVGLKSVLHALDNGKRVLLANKEALVAGGHLVMEKATENSLLPVDSEHSAIFQCLQGTKENSISRILLTCSGGPFRTWEKDAINNATREQALKHPNWVMGQKITIDSATLFNKALEVIEAKWLFNLSPSQIEVCIHPQSIIHSGVYFEDGALIAQLGTADMRLPILYAMSYPKRLPIIGEQLDLFAIGQLTFEKPDELRFPSLRIARECLIAGGAAGCVMNGANEVAVAHFLNTKNNITLGNIYTIVEDCLQKWGHLSANNLDEVCYADAMSREHAHALIKKLV